MSRECVQFNGRFLMKFLAEELFRAREEALRYAMRGGDDETFDSIYDKFMIIPLEIHEEAIQRNETVGHFTDPYARRSSSDECDARIECSVTEFKIPFEGDERLFNYTTHPMPYNPYGRVEEGSFIISVKEGDETHRSDYTYNLNRLRDCVERVKDSVELYNSDLREIISLFIAGRASDRRKLNVNSYGGQ